jgi:nicotinamide-nucleotide amidase
MDRLTRPPLRTAEVIAVGSELLGSTRVDTNSLFLSHRLGALGIDLRAKSVVGDSRDHLATMFTQALARVDLVVLTGGLGPTADDLTREVVAHALGLEVREDPTIVERLEKRFAARGMRMPAINRNQAMVPRGATALDNPNGTAPGLFIEAGDKVVLLLPGPPREMQPMVEGLATGALLERASDERIYRVALYLTGRGESHVEEISQPLYSPWARETPPIETTILASPGQVELHLSLRSSDPAAAMARLAEARDTLAAALGSEVYSREGIPLEQVVGELLHARGLTIATAESCTGGLLMSRLTDVAGSSAYVVAGVVVYSNTSKTQFADVDPALIAAHGAVSEPVAVALADGIRARTGADVGVGITGVAGPGGGTPQKPVGMVAIAVSSRDGAKVRTFNFVGPRAQVKFWATQAALDLVRRLLV